MPTTNLLITGVTGFIGFRILLDALKEGYSVRAAVRSLSQSESFLSHPKVKNFTTIGERLSFVEVPDASRENAYDQAVEDITYIIHLASPLPSPLLDPQTGIYEPSVKGVLNLLGSAHRQSTVKKLVITSSAVANLPFPPSAAQEISAESREANLEGPFNDMMTAYRAGKIAALNATDQFVKDNKPSFAVSSIFPGFVLGPDDRALNVKDLSNGTNRLLLQIITGNIAANPMPSGAAHVDDVAKVHLLALREGIVGDFGITKPLSFDDAWDVVCKHYPKAVQAGVFTQGCQPTIAVNWNAQKTESVFNIALKSYEDIVIDFAGQYLELIGSEKA